MPKDYTDMRTEDIYASLKYKRFPREYHANDSAELWVEAENMMAVRKLIIRWYRELEAGTADRNNRIDPLNISITQGKADNFIKVLDEEFDKEMYRAESLKIDTPVEFNRLSSNARIAFAQQIFDLIKDEDTLIAESERRIQAGEILPPKDTKKEYYKGPRSTQT
ncbi:MAG: hypothetical protein ABIH92_03295, partial [Nanoarchaeota archaeon]